MEALHIKCTAVLGVQSIWAELLVLEIKPQRWKLSTVSWVSVASHVDCLCPVVCENRQLCAQCHTLRVGIAYSVSELHTACPVLFSVHITLLRIEQKLSSRCRQFQVVSTLCSPLWKAYKVVHSEPLGKMVPGWESWGTLVSLCLWTWVHFELMWASFKISERSWSVI